MDLKTYIKRHHDGNVTAFARSRGIMPNQARRWLELGAIVRKGEIYTPATKRSKRNV